VLDSMMHADVRPFAPFSAASPLFHVVPLEFLHGLCVALGVGGLALLGLRSVLRSSRRPVGRWHRPSPSSISSFQVPAHASYDYVNKGGVFVSGACKHCW